MSKPNHAGIRTKCVCNLAFKWFTRVVSRRTNPEELQMHVEGRATMAGRELVTKATKFVPAHTPLAEKQSVIRQTRYLAEDPVIASLRATLANIQTGELKRLYRRLPELDDQSRDAIRQFADSLVANVLLPPIECLRNEESNASQEYLINALQRLFRLSA